MIYITNKGGARAHRLVARSAKAFCAELYEVYARKMPGFYEQWPSQNEFVRAHWGFFIQEARTTLAKLLATNLDEKLKDEIHDALIRDASLQPTRRGTVQVKMDL